MPSQSQEAERIKPWGIVATCSLISLISICTASKADGNRDSTEKFAVAVTSISFIIATLFMINAKWADRTGTPNLLNGTFIELLGALFNFVLWVFGLGFINTRNTDYYGGAGIKNANIYYFTWGAFLASLLTLFEVTKHIFNPTDVKHPRLGPWSILSAASLIVMIGCINAHISEKCKLIGNQSSFCSRAIFGISLGCISFALSGVTLLAVIFGPKDTKAILQIESILSFLIAICWCFGVAFLTGNNSPGTQIGNLYYFTWISFFSSLIIFLDCLVYIKPGAAEAITGQKRDRYEDEDDA